MNKEQFIYNYHAVSRYAYKISEIEYPGKEDVECAKLLGRICFIFSEAHSAEDWESKSKEFSSMEAGLAEIMREIMCFGASKGYRIPEALMKSIEDITQEDL